jgi:hypothetical protein
MLPGAVSLGAYEAGALAAILTAVLAAEGDLVVDAIASASAGSLTGLLATKCLLEGANPVTLMSKAWVDLPDISHLRTHSSLSPLTTTMLQSVGRQLLSEPVDAPAFVQRDPVHLAMSLTVLGGLSYNLSDVLDPQLQSDEMLSATTYLDWMKAELQPGSNLVDWLDGALASGANPLGFLPESLDRSRDEQSYKDQGIEAPPNGSYTFWYSDGGDVDNQPLGRLLDVIGELDGTHDVEREIVLLQVDPGGPEQWAGGEKEPSWLATLWRVEQIQTTQSLYDDLRTLQKTNQRIAWIKRLAATIDEEWHNDVERAAFASRMAQSLDRDRAEIRRRVASESTKQMTATPASIEGVLLQAAGLGDKKAVSVEMITSSLTPRRQPASVSQMAGGFLFHFGGFLDVAYRQNDFDLGYVDASAWLTTWLPSHVRNSERVMEAVTTAHAVDPAKLHGGITLLNLPFRQKIVVLRLLIHIAHVVVHDTVPLLFGIVRTLFRKAKSKSPTPVPASS